VSSLDRYTAAFGRWGLGMLRREFITFIGAAAAGWPLVARAQQTDRVRRIGALMDIGETDAGAKGWVEAFETSLDASGWHNGNNCAIDYRWGTSNPERLARNAQELLQSTPDVFLVHGTPALARPIRESAGFWSDWCVRTPPLTRRTGLPSAFHRLTTGTLQRA